MFGSPSVPIFGCLKMYIPWTTAGSSRPKSLATCRVFSLNVTYPTKNFTKLSIIFLCKWKCLHFRYFFLIELSFVLKKPTLILQKAQKSMMNTNLNNEVQTLKWLIAIETLITFPKIINIFNLLERRYMPVHGVSDLVEALVLVHLEVSVLVERILLEEKTNLVSRVQKVSILCLKFFRTT